MKHHNAPLPEEGETDLNFVVRLANWLNEPDRRRIGNETRDALVNAAKRLNGDDD